MHSAILKSERGDIAYTLTRRRGMKNIRVKIKKDGGIYVSADSSVSVARIEAFLLEKAEWITKNADEARQKADFFAPKLESGVRLFILGETLQLEVVCGKNEAAEKDGGFLTVTTNQPQNEAHTEHLILGYIAENGRKKLAEYFDCFFEKSGFSGVKPTLSLKLLKSKWGHCDRRKNEIMLNFSLCCLPPVLAEYVTAHEVAHLLVPNHSPLFYEAGERLMPGFRRYTKEMRSYSTELRSNIFRK